MKSSQTSLEAQFRPLQKKTFAASLDQFFAEQCPQFSGDLFRQVIVDKVQELVEEFYPPNTHLRMGQVMWPAVDENEKASYGKSIEKTKLKPVFLDLISSDDIESLLQGERKRAIRQRAAVRLFEQAHKQGAVLTEVDVGSMMRLSPVTISSYIREWEKDHDCIVPRRGTIHDMGPSITHKKVICRKVIVDGKSIEQTARETNHSPEAITRYVKDYKRILACLHQGLTPKDTAFVAKVSERLIYEYMALIEENQNDIKKQSNHSIMDDCPF
jgi:hypothetical protein